MASSVEKRPHVSTDNNANKTEYYIGILFAVIFGLAGTFFRFIQDSFLFTSISNILLIIGVVIALRAVFRIMK
ncbi:hypothetical protein [Olivibacter sitiensis]|uniref:hypothetical protein n=1 Tax=Olivibacter sitiensis TaxID=376470 RepID=UPI0004172868|nr:hypothetical protein [Olivibacter sitiensis]